MFFKTSAISRIASIEAGWVEARGRTLAKIAYEISKSFDFIEIKMISSDFSDFKNNFRLQKLIKCVHNFHLLGRLLIRIVIY